MFIGKSLTNIRILYDLSRSQLAEKIGVTEQAIWQYENGYVSPKLETINKLKEIFDVKGTYFYTSDLLEKYGQENIDRVNIAYRSETINSAHKTHSETMYLQYVDAFLKKIEGKISYPKNTLFELREEVVSFLRTHVNLERQQQISYIAALAREKIGLSKTSNKNLLFLLEKSGIFVFEKEIGQSIDAYSIWTNDHRAYIILGTLKKSAVRRNFDLAHELGHLLLHYKVEFTTRNTAEYKLLEKEADTFASEFLLPDNEFIKDFTKITKKSNPDAYIELKQKWLVSLQAIAIKAFKLKLIEYQQYRYFYMSINKKGYKEKEPLDDVILINRPSKVKSILQLLFEKNILSVSTLIDDLQINKRFLTKLTGIDEAFFDQYYRLENKTFSISDLNIKVN